MWLLRHTGAVVDLVVDDHVEVFLWEVLDSWYALRCVGDKLVLLTLEVCSDTSLKLNSLDILAVGRVSICRCVGDYLQGIGVAVFFLWADMKQVDVMVWHDLGL